MIRTTMAAIRNPVQRQMFRIMFQHKRLNLRHPFHIRHPCPTRLASLTRPVPRSHRILRIPKNAHVLPSRHPRLTRRPAKNPRRTHRIKKLPVIPRVIITNRAPLLLRHHFCHPFRTFPYTHYTPSPTKK